MHELIVESICKAISELTDPTMLKEQTEVRGRAFSTLLPVLLTPHLPTGRNNSKLNPGKAPIFKM